jgi:probable rRNA maturation factor
VSGLEIEVLGAVASVSARETRALCELALRSVGISDGHVAVEFVEENRIRELNRAHRGQDEPTDVLSFGVDENQPARGPRELGDIVICADHTGDVREAVIHGALHLAGMDHETDAGEMLALQNELLRARMK